MELDRQACAGEAGFYLVRINRWRNLFLPIAVDKSSVPYLYMALSA